MRWKILKNKQISFIEVIPRIIGYKFAITLPPSYDLAKIARDTDIQHIRRAILEINYSRIIPYILQMHSNEQVVNNNKQLLVLNNKDPRISCAKEIDFDLFDQHFGVLIEQFCLLLKKTHINAPHSFRTSYRGLPYISIWNVMRWKILKNKQIALKILLIKRPYQNPMYE